MVLYLNLGVLGATFLLLMRGDLRFGREVTTAERNGVETAAREREATKREREIGDVAVSALAKTADSLDRLTDTVLRDQAGGG